MANFFGTTGTDIADASTGTLTGFTGGTLAELQDGVGDTFYSSAGADSVVSGGGNDTFVFDSNHVQDGELIDGGGGANMISLLAGSTNFRQATIRDVQFLRFASDQLGPAVTSFRSDQIEYISTIFMAPSAGHVDWPQTLTITVAGTAFNMASTAIDATANDKIVILGGSTDEVITGSMIEDVIRGGGGADTLNGALGIDTLEGGAGNDIYYVDERNEVVTELADEGTDTVFTRADAYGLAANVENLRANLPGAVGQSLGGNSLANSIIGGSGNDLLEGEGGIDTLEGGGGNDQFFYDSISDLSFGESIDGGTGTDDIWVQRRGTTTMNFEFHSFDIISIERVIVQSITSGAVNVVMFRADELGAGLASGLVVLLGGTGTDTIRFDTATATSFSLAGITAEGWNSNTDRLMVVGDTDSETITGGRYSSYLVGNGGSDTLIAGVGFATLDGGGGVDVDTASFANTASTAPFGMRITLTSGGNGTAAFESSTVILPMAELIEIENITGSAGNDTITGDSEVNVLRGLAGLDILNGGGGADTMIGGSGSDRYFFDAVGDAAVELLGEGTDTVETIVNYTLRPNLENLTLLGGATTGVGNELNNGLFGNGLANLLSGLAGNDLLNGGAGADVMRGGLGNDQFYVDNVGDIPVETLNQGTDTVSSQISYTLRADFEDLYLIVSVADLNAVGNTSNNIVRGNVGNNLIGGRGGNDTLGGSAGFDTFLFDTALNGTTNRDTITDFSAAQDVFRLSSAIFGAIPTGVLAANQFRVSTSAGDADDRIIYDQASGFVYYDANGNGAGGQTLFAILTTKPTLTAADFVVI